MLRVTTLSKRLSASISAASAGLIVLLAATTGAAGATSKAPGYRICSDKGTGLCVTAEKGATGAGAAVVGLAKTSGATQLLYAAADNMCGGSNVVTLKCPFTVGSGLNRKFKGKAIYEIHWASHPTYCLGITYVSGKADVVSRYCKAGLGTVWVKGGPYDYVNRAVSDSSKGVRVLNAPATKGSLLTVGKWTSGLSQW